MPEVVEIALHGGSLVSGILRIHPKNYEEAYISSPDGKSDICIQGMKNRNRALHGDKVAVNLNPESEWMIMSGQLRDFQLLEHSEKCDEDLEEIENSDDKSNSEEKSQLCEAENEEKLEKSQDLVDNVEALKIDDDSDIDVVIEEVQEVRDDAIMATGRSDYPNQVNNVLGFPFIFRGALDVKAKKINEEMKIAAANAIAELARQDVPDEVNAAYHGVQLHYGNDYIIPAPFDPRLISSVSSAVAKAAMDTGVAKKPIKNLEAYRRELEGRTNPIASILEPIKSRIKSKKQKVVFAEGEEEKTIRAALSFYNSGFGIPILIGRENRVRETMKEVNLEGLNELIIHNASLSKNNKSYIDSLYKRLHRHGHLRRDCQRLINQDRNVFAASMVSAGDADAMVTGVTRPFGRCFDDITKVISPKNDESFLSMSMMVSKERTVFIGDVNIHDTPNAEQLANIATGIANTVRSLGYTPRVALLSFSNFGSLTRPSSRNLKEAVNILNTRNVDFEFDGEMTPEVALDYDLIKENYPFCRLSGPANVLIMPSLLSANISFKLLQKLGGGSILGPLMIGGEKPFQIVQMGSSVSDIVNSASIAAYNSLYTK